MCLDLRTEDGTSFYLNGTISLFGGEIGQSKRGNRKAASLLYTKMAKAEGLCCLRMLQAQ